MAREKIIEEVLREVVGPDPVKPSIQDNGEEILNIKPTKRYGAGILFPQKTTYESLDKSFEDEDIQVLPDEGVEETQIGEIDDTKIIGDDDNSTNDEILNLVNSYLPSAMGFTALILEDFKSLEIEIKCARYEKQPLEKKQGYFRIPLNGKIILKPRDLPNKDKKTIKRTIKSGQELTDLELVVVSRGMRKKAKLITFSLVNNARNQKEYIESEKCYFQVSMVVRATEEKYPFLNIPPHISDTDDEDMMSSHLLYRNNFNFSTGHGCAVEWGNAKMLNNESATTDYISTSTIPVVETFPVKPRRKLFENLDLSMYDLSGEGSFEKGITNLSMLIDEYEKWIKNKRNEAKKISDLLIPTALRHLKNCDTYLSRIKRGFDLINNDKKSAKAFKYMNLAILTQQLRHNLKTREWKTLEELEPLDPLDVHDSDTWPKQGLGQWYPFQIGFILACIEGVVKTDSDERNWVDTLWFPTGGGKTEAYLGLTAFTIFHRRLKKKNNGGTVALMRYTLRLLTTQQFQRAASLITACETIRRNEPELGSIPISIGLWVGNSASPNRRDSSTPGYPGAKQLLDKLWIAPDRNKNPFIVLKCPWCGARMGPVMFKSNNSNSTSYEIKGYKRQRLENQKYSVVFICGDADCEFSNNDSRLPIYVIDEDIYDFPPSLIIGTVDKFASIPFKSDCHSIFGIGSENSPPELIIQDELHLISGPLGSMVGMYETLVDGLCEKDGINPKIIASTATITRAREQIKALYNCDSEKVGLFPPPGLEENDSFFGKKSNDSLESRKYLGVFPSGYTSSQTAQVRLIGAVLQSTKTINVENETELDPYWTLMYYFNSLRELGHAVTLIRDDIQSYLPKIQRRKQLIDNENKRYSSLKYIELTSRAPNEDIIKALERLDFEYPADDKTKNPVDICMATNMISVGLDIGRLGLMVVNGQPKSFAEYIQTTSRVGRQYGKPGMVITIYNVCKPRDRSHYEHFRVSHESMYSMVEPSSVTPFSSPVRERALHAIVVGLCRAKYSALRDLPGELPDNIEDVIEFILTRVSGIDIDEYDNTSDNLNNFIQKWRQYNPTIYGNMGGYVNSNESWPLLYPAGKAIEERLKPFVTETPTSLRNVDAECRGMILQQDYSRYLSDD